MASKELTTQDFQEMDKIDEAQIIAELQGAVIEEYTYSFKSGGRQVTGLSWAGVKAIANKIGDIKVDLVQVLDNPHGYAVVCQATQGSTSRLGAAEQSKFIKGDQPDPFALAKAISKAQRNAIRALIPEAEILAMVKRPAPPPPPANGKIKTIDDLLFAISTDLGLTEQAAKEALHKCGHTTFKVSKAIQMYEDVERLVKTGEMIPF